MLIILAMMLLIVVVAAVVLIYVSFPYVRDRMPQARGLVERIDRIVGSAPTLEHTDERRADQNPSGEHDRLVR